MRSYERNGVTIDQCGECRGVFLDRGELERLISAEEQAYGTPPSNVQYRESEHTSGHGSGHGSSKYGSQSGKRKRGGFLGDLFD